MGRARTKRKNGDATKKKRDAARAEGKTVGRVEQADEFINFKSWLQCRLVGGAFMALRPGCPLCLSPRSTHPSLQLPSSPIQTNPPLSRGSMMLNL